MAMDRQQRFTLSGWYIPGASAGTFLVLGGRRLPRQLLEFAGGCGGGYWSLLVPVVVVSCSLLEVAVAVTGVCWRLRHVALDVALDYWELLDSTTHPSPPSARLCHAGARDNPRSIKDHRLPFACVV